MITAVVVTLEMKSQVIVGSPGRVSLAGMCTWEVYWNGEIEYWGTVMKARLSAYTEWMLCSSECATVSAPAGASCEKTGQNI